MTTELRTVPTRIELRKVGNKTVIRGFAAKYNTISSNLGGFRETLAHGAFRSALKRGDDVRMTFNHSADQVLGRTKSKTLRLMEKCGGGAHENCGLWFEADLPDTQIARDLATSIQRGDIDSCSFAFQVPSGGDDWDEGTDENGLKYPRRTVRDVNPLIDVSAVTYPAYPNGTSVDVSMLTAAHVSSASLKVSPRALQEARSRGGYTPKPPSQTAKKSESQADLRDRMETWGRIIKADDALAVVDEARARQAATDRNHGRYPMPRSY
jgi:HK97 family phage prohead protease